MVVRTKRAYLAARRPKLLGRLDLLVQRALCRAATTSLCRRTRWRRRRCCRNSCTANCFPLERPTATKCTPLGEERRQREREASGSGLRVFEGRRQLKRSRLLLKVCCRVPCSGGERKSGRGRGGQTTTSMGGGGSNRSSESDSAVQSQVRSGRMEGGREGPGSVRSDWRNRRGLEWERMRVLVLQMQDIQSPGATPALPCLQACPVRCRLRNRRTGQPTSA